jgi:hypothetical protein
VAGHAGNEALQIRKNRLKKNARQPGNWLGRLLLGLKLTALIAVMLGVSALFVGLCGRYRLGLLPGQDHQNQRQRTPFKAEVLLRPGSNAATIFWH